MQELLAINMSVWLKMQIIRVGGPDDGTHEIVEEGLIKFCDPANDFYIVNPTHTAIFIHDAERVIGRSDFAHISSMPDEVLMKISREQLKIKIGEFNDGDFLKTEFTVENIGKLDVRKTLLQNGVEVNIGGFFRCRFMYFDGYFRHGAHPNRDILRGIPDPFLLDDTRKA